MTDPIWSPDPDRLARANMTRFLAEVRRRRPAGSDGVEDYPRLYRWSVDHLDAFWPEVWRFCGVVADERAGREPWDDILIGLERTAPPDPPQALDLRRRVPLRRKGGGLTRALARGAHPDSRDRARDRGPVPSPCARHLRHPRRHPVGPAPGRLSRSRASLLCPPALRPSAVHHVLVRHHGPAQVHGARRGGHAAPASEGAGAAHRPR